MNWWSSILLSDLIIFWARKYYNRNNRYSCYSCWWDGSNILAWEHKFGCAFSFKLSILLYFETEIYFLEIYLILLHILSFRLMNQKPIRWFSISIHQHSTVSCEHNNFFLLKRALEHQLEKIYLTLLNWLSFAACCPLDW